MFPVVLYMKIVLINIVTGRVRNLQIRVVMDSAELATHSEKSICAYSEPPFALAEIRDLPCTHLISGRYVRFITFLTMDTMDEFNAAEIDVFAY